ncbi:MAG: hypothetical protein O8C61_06900 [Candidatus Methanoperedens sp.]|nr:hypothetical protein [Candidatus Methanoperedens sp.]
MTKNMILIISVLGILMINFASADVPPENSHPLNRCVKFVNLNNFSDVVLIGYYTGPMVKYEAYQIENDKCLDKGYKLNSLYIYWTTKEKFHSINLENLKLDSKKVAWSGGDDGNGNTVYYDVYSPANLTLLLENIEPYGGYVNENNPLINETIEYSVAGYSDGKLVVYISKKTSEYNNGQSAKVETFEKPDINNKESISTPTPEPTQNPEPQPVKTGFWNSISCFFKKLFGGSC